MVQVLMVVLVQVPIVRLVVAVKVIMTVLSVEVVSRVYNNGG